VDIASVIADLRSQLDDVSQVIRALEQLSLSQPRRSGRPQQLYLCAKPRAAANPESIETVLSCQNGAEIWRLLRTTPSTVRKFRGANARTKCSLIRIRRDVLASDVCSQVKDLTAHLWLETGVQGDSTQEDPVAAVQESRGAATAGLFLVPRRKSSLHRFLLVWLHLN
jgi:hypothetical protein